MKVSLWILPILCPALGWAQLGGDWAGVSRDSQGAHRIVLHVSGPFTAMKGSIDFPDQKLSNAPVESITFLESTLDFSIPASDLRFSGVLNDNGAIAGTLTQHGVGVPLVLARAPTAAEAPKPTVAIRGGAVENGRYHDEITGVEFDLPSAWVVSQAGHEQGRPGGLTQFADRSGKATIITVYMMKTALSPEGVSKALERVIPWQISMRDGQTGGGPLHTVRNYKIRDGSVDMTYIGGYAAVRAVGDFERGDKKFSEALAWIITEHTRTYFMVRGATEDLPSLRASLDQVLQSAKIP
jgi:hypothetical protein